MVHYAKAKAKDVFNMFPEAVQAIFERTAHQVNAEFPDVSPTIQQNLIHERAYPIIFGTPYVSKPDDPYHAGSDALFLEWAGKNFENKSLYLEGYLRGANETIEERDTTIAERDATIEERDTTITSLQQSVEKKKQILHIQDTRIVKLESDLAAVKMDKDIADKAKKSKGTVQLNALKADVESLKTHLIIENKKAMEFEKEMKAQKCLAEGAIKANKSLEKALAKAKEQHQKMNEEKLADVTKSLAQLYGGKRKLAAVDGSIGQGAEKKQKKDGSA